MDAETLAVEAIVEEHHWWFTGRRRLFARLLRDAGVDPAAPALDVGTGTGANLRLLRDAGFSQVRGVDASPVSIRWCRDKGLGEVMPGDMADLPLADQSQELIMATDVLEHLDDDRQGMQEIARVLRPGGMAIITVPTFMALWGPQDDLSHHKRRYRLPALARLAAEANLHIERQFYFNALLALPIWCARRALLWSRRPISSENAVNGPIINRILTCIFRCDVWMAPWVRFPCGVSGCIVVRRPRVAGRTRDQA